MPRNLRTQKAHMSPLLASEFRRQPRPPRAPRKPQGSCTPRSPRHFPSYACSLARPRLAHSGRSEEHTSELQSRFDLVCRLLLEKQKHNKTTTYSGTEIIE